MTKEEKTLTTVLMAVALAFFIGVAVTMVLASLELDVAEHRYEQLEEQYNQLTDQHWNLQQEYLKLENNVKELEE